MSERRNSTLRLALVASIALVSGVLIDEGIQRGRSLEQKTVTSPFINPEQLLLEVAGPVDNSKEEFEVVFDKIFAQLQRGKLVIERSEDFPSAAHIEEAEILIGSMTGNNRKPDVVVSRKTYKDSQSVVRKVELRFPDRKEEWKVDRLYPSYSRFNREDGSGSFNLCSLNEDFCRESWQTIWQPLGHLLTQDYNSFARLHNSLKLFPRQPEVFN